MLNIDVSICRFAVWERGQCVLLGTALGSTHRVELPQLDSQGEHNEVSPLPRALLDIQSCNCNDSGIIRHDKNAWQEQVLH